MTGATLQRYSDVADMWRWRMLADDGHPLADGTHSFDSAAALDIHLERLRAVTPEVSIVDGGDGAVVIHSDERIGVIDTYGEERSHAHDPTLGSFDHLDSLDPMIFHWTPQDADVMQWIADNWERFPVYDADPGLFICHIGHDGEWRWLLRLDGEAVAESGEGYANLPAAESAARRTRNSIESADEDTWGAVQNA